MARILITGAGGTIGRILLRDLAHLQPIGVTRRDYDLVNPVDFSVMMEKHQPDVIIHCACTGGKHTLGMFNEKDLIDNIMMFENIQRHSFRLKRIINIGSGAEYGLHNPIREVEEAYLHTGAYGVPRDSYGLSKWLAWQRFETIDNAINLRLFGCFDPIEPDFRLMRRFVNTTNRGEKFILRQDREFSWISGTDLSNIISEIIERTFSWKWWKSGFPKTMNIAYPETSNMLLSEMLDRWCYLHGIKPSWELENDEIGSPYTCTADEMTMSIKKSLKGFDACLEDYQ